MAKMYILAVYIFFIYLKSTFSESELPPLCCPENYLIQETPKSAENKQVIGIECAMNDNSTDVLLLGKTVDLIKCEIYDVEKVKNDSAPYLETCIGYFDERINEPPQLSSVLCLSDSIPKVELNIFNLNKCNGNDTKEDFTNLINFGFEHGFLVNLGIKACNKTSTDYKFDISDLDVNFELFMAPFNKTVNILNQHQTMCFYQSPSSRNTTTQNIQLCV